MLPREIFKNGAIWCVLENILLKFCKIIDNVLHCKYNINNNKDC